MNKQFDALLGHCYGRLNKEPSANFIYRERSGQAFWYEISGDKDFYKRLISCIDDTQIRINLIEYEREWDKARNRYLFEFVQKYCLPSGEIDWEKIVELNSGTAQISN